MTPQASNLDTLLATKGAARPANLADWDDAFSELDAASEPPTSFIAPAPPPAANNDLTLLPDEPSEEPGVAPAASLLSSHILRSPQRKAQADKAQVDPVPFDKRSMRKPGFYYLKCDNGHYWMSAYVFIVEHPYYAVTDAKGTFELTKVPPGTYTLKFWHENWRAKPVVSGGKVVDYSYEKPLMHSVQVTVKGGEAAEANWVVSGK